MPLTTVNPGLLDTQAQYTGFKNRIINGQMQIDQRNAGASVSGTGVFGVDRFVTDCVNSTLQSQRSSDVPSGQGFSNSLAITVTAPSSNSATDFAAVNQKIEAFNVSDFMLGTANATTMTLSFWVKASITGTYVVSFQNGLASRRSYAATYVINSANTWERKTITITGDTSGTWETGNGQGIWARFSLGGGSDFSGSAGSWQSGNIMQVSGATKFSDTSGATFYITGVQLEKGSTATSFDYRPYGTELALCQRYYQRSVQQVGTSFEYGSVYISYIQAQNGNWVGGNLPFKAEMRANPTFRNSGGAGTIGTVLRASTSTNPSVTLGAALSGSVTAFVGGAVSASESIMFAWDAYAEL